MPSVNEILQDMEQKLIESYNKNIGKYADNPSAWQSRKLIALRNYQRESKIITSNALQSAVEASTKELTKNFNQGASEAEDSIKMFYELDENAGFSAINTEKLDSIVNEVNGIYSKVISSSYLYGNNQYREILKEAQIYLDSGVGTLKESIDIAAKEFLSQGITSVKYSNSSMVNVVSYAEMVLRTNSKTAYLTGQGERADEFGIHTVQVSSYNQSSDTCLPWQGRVYIDDVYSNGSKDSEGADKYPMLSVAVNSGLYHPNCRHTQGMYFEGVSSLPKQPNEAKVQKQYKAEERQRAIERNIRKYKRLEQGSVDDSNKAKYHRKVLDWQKAQREHINNNSFLRRDYRREKV